MAKSIHLNIFDCKMCPYSTHVGINLNGSAVIACKLKQMNGDSAILAQISQKDLKFTEIPIPEDCPL